MLLALLFDTPMMFLVIVLGIVYALTVHEFAHAAAATYLGDNTAKFAGRLSLNPLVHLDIFALFGDDQLYFRYLQSYSYSTA